LTDIPRHDGPLHGIYLQKNPVAAGARHSNSLKCAVILRGAASVAVFLTMG
jgi:hypothetical protein